jgi:hypothetical protein
LCVSFIAIALREMIRKEIRKESWQAKLGAGANERGRGRERRE